MRILTLNCWSSSVGYHLIEWTEKKVLASGRVERVTLGAGHIVHTVPGRRNRRRNLECPDLGAAISVILELLTDPVYGVIAAKDAIDAVGHRVVHGGEKFHQTVIINDGVITSLRKLIELAPLHNANNIAGIEAAIALLPAIPHAAVFDTAFHQTMSPQAYIYPLPYEWYTDYGVRRYGFHGPAHLYAARRAAGLLGKTWPECRLISIARSKGVSLCAIRDGRSVDTSMGLTPLEGAVMDTRCGDIDPGIPPFIMQHQDLSPREMESILNLKSGLLGLAGYSDRARLVARARKGDDRAHLALDLEAYRLKKQIGAYLAVLGPTDAVVFTGGGRFDWLLRERALAGLEHMGIVLDGQRNRTAGPQEEMLISSSDSPVRIAVVPTRAEMIISEEVAATLAGTAPDPCHCERPG